MDRLDLRAQLIGHGRTMRFVVGVEVAAKSLPLRVKHDRDIAVGISLYEAADHVDHALHCPGWLLLAVNQRRQRVKGAEEIGRAVY